MPIRRILFNAFGVIAAVFSSASIAHAQSDLGLAAVEIYGSRGSAQVISRNSINIPVRFTVSNFGETSETGFMIEFSLRRADGSVIWAGTTNGRRMGGIDSKGCASVAIPSRHSVTFQGTVYVNSKNVGALAGSVVNLKVDVNPARAPADDFAPCAFVDETNRENNAQTIALPIAR